MGAVASLSETSLAVDPGGEVVCDIRVRNTGDVVDEFTFEVVGPTADWTTVSPASLRLFPDTEERATVRFAPPREPTTPTGELPFGIRVASREDPEGSVVEEGVVRVAPFGDVFAELIPRTSKGRRRARHDLAVDNRGNTRVNADVVAFDHEEALDFDVDPPAVVAEAGTASFAKLTVRPRERYWRGPPQTRTFQVQVHPDGMEPLQVDGTMVQEAVLPRWLPRALLLLGLLLIALAVLWLTVLRPTIESAARDAVEEPLNELAAENAAQDQAIAGAQEQAGQAQDTANEALEAVGGTPPPSPSPTPGDGEVPTEDVPFDLRLAGADAPGGAVATEVFTVAAGSTLQLTDIVLQNPVGHAGFVRVRRVTPAGVSTLLEVAMENFRDLDYHFVTPITFTEGMQLRFDVECVQPAEGSTACGAGAYFSGVMTQPVPEPAPSPSPTG